MDQEAQRASGDLPVRVPTFMKVQRRRPPSW